MATIVTQYDPWREKLAASLGVNLLSDAIQRGRAADAQRKNNAAYVEIAKRTGMLGQGEQAQPQTLTDPLMGTQITPDGYNDNAWAKTMHDTYTPMTQFNIGTAGLGTQTQAQKTNAIPSQTDYLRAFAEILDTPRFNSVNFNDIYSNMLIPTMEASAKDYASQLAEQQRSIQQDYANSLLGAESRDKYGRILNAFFASGNAPKDAINAMQKNYEYLFPNYEKQLIDNGGTIFPTAFSPATGQTIFNQDKNGDPLGISKTIAPYEAAKIGFDYDKLNTETGYNYYKTNQGVEQNRQKNFLTYQDQAMKRLAEEKKNLNEELEKSKQNMMGETDPQKRAELEAKHHQIEARLADVQQLENALRLEGMYRFGLAQRPQSIHSGEQQQGGQGKTVLNSRIQEYSDIIEKIAQEEGVDADLIRAIMQAESSGNPNAISKAGAQGLMQLMPQTAKRWGVTNSFDPEQNIRGGAKYLKWLYDRYNGELDKIAWGYNAGEGNADKGYMPKPDETGPYRKNVVNIYNSLKSQKKQQQAQPAQQQTQNAQPKSDNIMSMPPRELAQQRTAKQPQTPSETSGNQEQEVILINGKGETATVEIARQVGKGDVNKGIKILKSRGFTEYTSPKETTNAPYENYGIFTNPLYEFTSGDTFLPPEMPTYPPIDAISSAQPRAADMNKALGQIPYLGDIDPLFEIGNSVQPSVSTQYVRPSEREGNNPLYITDAINNIQKGIQGIDINPTGNNLIDSLDASVSSWLHKNSSLPAMPKNTSISTPTTTSAPVSYVDISQSPETWQNPSDLLRRSYMQTGGEQSVLDELNGGNTAWDGNPLYEPNRTNPLSDFYRDTLSWRASGYSPKFQTGNQKDSTTASRFSGRYKTGLPSLWGEQAPPITFEQLIELQTDPLINLMRANPSPYDPLYFNDNSAEKNAFREFLETLALSRWLNSENAVNGFYSRFRER